MTRMNEMAGVYGAVVCVTALVAAGCCDCATGAKPLVDIPKGHKPQVIMGRDCWRVLNRYTAYGWAGKFVARDNSEFNADPAVADVVPCYVAAANPPPPTGTNTASSLFEHWRRISIATVPWPAITSSSSYGGMNVSLRSFTICAAAT